MDSQMTQRDDVVEIAGPGFSCRVAADFADVLGPLLEESSPDAWSGLEEIKSSTVRRILRGELSAPAGVSVPVHLKLYRAAQLSDRARDAVRGSKSAREFANLREARARGLPCVEPLAAGVFTGSFGSRSFLLTRTEPGTSLTPGPLPAECARRVGALLRQCHDVGLHAEDLHAANVLQREDGRLVLLDLTSAAFANPLEFDQRAHGLAYFCRGLDGSVLDPAARPLVESYGASSECVQKAARLGARLRHRGLSAFGRRAFRACLHTAIEHRAKSPRWCLHRPAQHLHEAARALIEDPPTPDKSGRRGSVHLADDLVLKERTAAASRRLFRAAYWLLFAGVPCPMPVALWTWQRRGRVVSSRVSGDTLAAELAAGMSDAAMRESARRLGCSVGRLHAHGLRNRDMKLENLVRDPQTGEIAMVDLDGVRRRVPGERRGQAADLGRLLAAYRAAGEPGGRVVLFAFVRGYIRARTCLLQRPKIRHLMRLTAERAAAWASAHPAALASPGSSATLDGASSAG